MGIIPPLPHPYWSIHFIPENTLFRAVTLFSDHSLLMKHRRLLLLLFLPSFYLFFPTHVQARVSPEGFREDLSLPALQNRAFEAQLPYLVYIQDPGKRNSKRMLRTTWAHEEVKELIESHFLAAVYSPYEQGEQVELISRYKVYGFPSLLIFSPDGTLLGKSEGFLAPGTMVAILNKHLSQLQHRSDMVAMAEIVSRGHSYQSRSRSTEMMDMTPPLLVGSMVKFSVPDATNTTASIRDISPVGSLTVFGNKSRGQPEQRPGREEDISIITLPSQRRATETNSTAHSVMLEVSGMESYSLRQLQTRTDQAEEIYGLLVGSYRSFAEAETEVARFERLWRDRIFVYCEKTGDDLVYKVVLGEYLNLEVARAFSEAILKMEGINPSILPLSSFF